MTVLIKNGLVYDGSGETPVKKDILVRGERIVRISDNMPKRQADLIVDAVGAIVTPGFIDINASLDHYLNIFTDSTLEGYIRQGVTTVIGGNCGASLAPLFSGSLAPIRKWGNVSEININWHSLAEFFLTLEKQGLGVNFGTLVGHSTIRRALTGETPRDLTDSELEILKETLTQAFKDGAYGFSTGLEYVHSKMVPHHEIAELVQVTAKEKRVYATHLRELGNGLKKSFQEVIDIAKLTGANIEISHFQPLKGFDKNYLKAKEVIEREMAETSINFDCYPSDKLAVPIYQFLPDWAKKGNLEAMLRRVNSDHLEKKLLAHFRKVSPEDVYICHVDKSLKFLVGKSLEEYAGGNNFRSDEALLKLMKLSHLRAVLFHRLVDVGLLEGFLTSSYSFIASGEVGLPIRPLEIPQGGQTQSKPADSKSGCESRVFTEFIKWVKKEKKISMEKAIAKVTSLPAGKYKIEKRGLIKEDNYADIVVLRDDGPSDVLVNGQLALEQGNFKKVLAGNVLRASK
ncbi:MAG: hypothetical protein KJI72_00465 [Patescibacteria group bacterium]|nr:hypothetical protein [Patescibacteria group bacterium]